MPFTTKYRFDIPYVSEADPCPDPSSTYQQWCSRPHLSHSYRYASLVTTRYGCSRTTPLLPHCLCSFQFLPSSNLATKTIRASHASKNQNILVDFGGIITSNSLKPPKPLPLYPSPFPSPSPLQPSTPDSPSYNSIIIIIHGKHWHTVAGLF